jgi:hypothetical protein
MISLLYEHVNPSPECMIALIFGIHGFEPHRCCFELFQLCRRSSTFAKVRQKVQYLLKIFDREAGNFVRQRYSGQVTSVQGVELFRQLFLQCTCSSLS